MMLQKIFSVTNKRRFVSAALLSIVVPVSLLATFRLTGIFPEPPQQEMMTVEQFTWTADRPSTTVTIDEWVQNYYKDDGKASVGLGVHIAGYREDWPGWWPSDGDDDVVDLKVVATTNVSGGFVCSVVIRLCYADTLAVLIFQQSSGSMELYNLEIDRVRYLGTPRREACFETIASDRPESVRLAVIAYWVFRDKNDTFHSVTASLEVVYFDGSTYRKVVMPIELQIRHQDDAGSGTDAANSFRTPPRTVLTGFQTQSFYGYMGPSYVGLSYDEFCGDRDDWYGFWVDDEYGPEVITALLCPPQNANFDLELYDPFGERRDYSRNGNGTLDFIDYGPIGSFGWWQIRVFWVTGEGEYRFEVGVYTHHGTPDQPLGCPYVSAWNGSAFVLDNNVLASSERSGGADVTDYMLQRKPVLKADGSYTLLLSDNLYAKIMSGSQIELSFIAPLQTMEKRYFIIVIEGHYFRIG